MAFGGVGWTAWTFLYSDEVPGTASPAAVGLEYWKISPHHLLVSPLRRKRI